MSGISLRDYSSIARLDQTGTIRVSRDDDSQLVNKGTLGQRIASWWSDVKQAIGWSQPDLTRADRQTAALDGFRKALTGTYGEEVANQALGTTEFGRNQGAPLTGRVVSIAVQNADAIAKGNRLVNTGTMNKLLPPIPPGEPTQEFRALVQTLQPNVTVEQLTPRELTEFEARFRSRTAMIDLTAERKPDQINAIARQTLAEVHALQVAGKLDAAIVARQALAVVLTEIIQGLADGRSPSTMMPLLAVAVARLDRNGRAEGLDADGQTEQLMTAVLGQVMRELKDKDPTLLARAQDNALSHGSSLRAILAQIDAQPDDQLSPRQQAVLSQVETIAETIIEGIATVNGPRSVSPDSDMQRLNNTDDLSGSKQQQALGPVNRLLDHITDNPTAPSQFIKSIRTKFASIDPETRELSWNKAPNGVPLWSSVEVLEELDRNVRHYAVYDKIAIDEAAENMRAAINRDPHLPDGLKAKLGAGLDAIVEEFKLCGMTSHESFKNLKQEDFWRLFVPQRLVDENMSKWDIEHREQGSLAGMQRAFRTAITEGFGDTPEQRTPEHLATRLEDFHKEATKDCSRTNVLNFTYMEQFADQHAQYKDDAPLRPGYRNGPTSLTLRPGTEITPEGLAELRRFREDYAPHDENNLAWFVLNEDGPGGEISLEFEPKTPNDCEPLARHILQQFYDELPNRHTDNDKRLLVAETVQTLYRLHLFGDGNSRTVVFAAMNRMLLDAGLSPAILPEPKGAAGFSRQQFADEIRKGQIAFELLTKPDDVSVADLLTRQLERIEREDVPRATGIVILRGLIDGNEGLPGDLRTEALQCLDAEALRLEDSLYSHLQEVPGFAGIRRDEVWRLFGGEHVQRPGAAYQLPQLEHAFDVMLFGLRLESPLNAEHLELIGSDGPSPGYHADLDPDQCRQQINDILGDYRNGIENADTDQAKLYVIADAVNRLYEGKFFPDGQTQSTVVMVMNRMLVDAGLSPAMLGHPTSLGGDTSTDVADVIAQGQLAFRWHARSADTTMAAFLTSEAERHARELKVSLPEALGSLLISIENNPAIPPAIRDDMTRRLVAMIDALPRKDSVVDELDKQRRDIEALQHVKKDDLWRLVATGHEQSDRTQNHLKSRDDLLQRHGIGVVVGMENACGVMLDGCRTNTRLDADHILAINDANPQSGLRGDATELVIDMGGWFDRRGVEQMLRDDPWYQGGELREIDPSDRGERYQVTLPGGKSREQCREKLQSILDQYDADMKDADGERAKRAAIGKAVQAMYRAQMFGDGERQSTVFMVMNRMLLDAGLPPAIYLDPAHAFGYRPVNVGTAILQGQSGFRQFLPEPIEVINLPPEDNLQIGDDESSEDEIIVAPDNLQFNEVNGRRTANARDLLSIQEWGSLHTTHYAALLDDHLLQSDNARYDARQEKMAGRELTFRTEDGPYRLEQSREVPDVILKKTNIGDTVVRKERDNEIQERMITAQDTAMGLSRFIDPGLFDGIYRTVAAKFAPDAQIDRPPLGFSINQREATNGEPVYDVVMRGPMPQGIPNDPPCDLVVTMQVDATASFSYDVDKVQARLEQQL